MYSHAPISNQNVCLLGRVCSWVHILTEHMPFVATKFVTPKRHLVTLYKHVSFVALFLFVCLGCFTPQAYAKDYEITKVDINATVQADGSLVVEERRTFSFDGSFHGVYWKLPQGSYEDRFLSASDIEAGMIENGDVKTFQNALSEQDGTYTYYDEGSYKKVKIYQALEDCNATFFLKYTVKHAASRYTDTSMLYWKFVSDGWDRPSENVVCHLTLPIPANESIQAGENVRAWGHGPLDGNVQFEENSITFTSPVVDTADFAEMRVLFPKSWLTSAPQIASAKKDAVLSEEEGFARQANERRQRAQHNVYIIGAIGLCMLIVTILLLVWYVRTKRALKPHFSDEYFRDIPSFDHPAVLGYLFNDMKLSDQLLSASIMRLCDMGVCRLVCIDKGSEGGFLGIGKKDPAYGLELCSSLQKSADIIDAYEEFRTHNADYKNQITRARKLDRQTLHLIFEEFVALRDESTKKRKRISEASCAPEHTFISFEDIQTIAQKHTDDYQRSYQVWGEAVQGASYEREFFVETPHETSVSGVRLLSMFVVIANLVGMFWVLFTWLTMRMHNIPYMFSIFLITEAIGIIGIVCGALCFSKLSARSREAIELTAKMDALKNWLLNFTRLRDALPSDLVLWNKLLIMACVFGISKEVSESLRVAYPELEEHPDMIPLYEMWYFHNAMYMPSYSPLDDMHQAFEAAHHEAIDTTLLSSGSGFGGGFSSGGGGGFGGGGGGGAF